MLLLFHTPLKKRRHGAPEACAVMKGNTMKNFVFSVHYRAYIPGSVPELFGPTPVPPPWKVYCSFLRVKTKNSLNTGFRYAVGVEVSHTFSSVLFAFYSLLFGGVQGGEWLALLGAGSFLRGLLWCGAGSCHVERLGITRKRGRIPVSATVTKCKDRTRSVHGDVAYRK